MNGAQKSGVQIPAGPPNSRVRGLRRVLVVASLLTGWLFLALYTLELLMLARQGFTPIGVLRHLAQPGSWPVFWPLMVLYWLGASIILGAARSIQCGVEQ